jgi:hypothetical protein
MVKEPKTVQYKTLETASPDIRVLEFHARLDKESIPLVDEQIFKSRVLYNEIIAKIREVHEEMQMFTLERAGTDALRIKQEIDALSEEFAIAKAKDDEDAMMVIAEKRRGLWREGVGCTA